MTEAGMTEEGTVQRSPRAAGLGALRDGNTGQGRGLYAGHREGAASRSRSKRCSTTRAPHCSPSPWETRRNPKDS